MIPRTIQPKATFSVCASSATIIPKQTNTPIVETKGTKGALKGLGISGFLIRMIHTPALTSTKANKVPKLVKSPAT